MAKSELDGKAQTVLGPVPAEALGSTLSHEHLLVDLSVWFVEPTRASERGLAYQPVCLENLGWVHYNAVSNLDNTRLLDEEVAIREALLYKRAGGNTIADVTNVGLARDPLALARIARATGLNIIMGSGYYAGASIPSHMHTKTEDQIAAEIVQDITVGVDDTGVRAGLIGEIGCSWPLQDIERKAVRAAAMAQHATGAPVILHPGRNENSPFEIAKLFAEAGGDLSRTVICHIDRTLVDPEKRRRLAEWGCYLEYDLFGWEGYYPTALAVVDMPSDPCRLNEIQQLIGWGHLNQVLMSHDICMKMRLTCYGGSGYAHILRNVVPLMKAKGFSEAQSHTLLVENPKRLFQFV